MNRRVTYFAALALIGIGGLAGCVSSGTHNEAIRHAELRLQSEQRLTQELATSNKELRFRNAELESTLRSVRDQLMRTDKEWRDARDELLKIKISQEQHAVGHERFPYLDRPGFGKEARPKPKEQAEDAVQRAKELLRQLHILLEQFTGKEPL